MNANTVDDIDVLNICMPIKTLTVDSWRVLFYENFYCSSINFSHLSEKFLKSASALLINYLIQPLDTSSIDSSTMLL